jgi:GntR family carbon starvation induced transcriptional regulator
MDGYENIMKKQTVAEDVLEKIRREILLGRYRAGDRINIDQLKREYGVSLTPVREALNRLASMSYIELIPNKGFRVAFVTLDEVLDLYETWLFIFKQAIEQAIKHGDDSWEATVLAAAHRLHKFETSPEFLAEPDLFGWVSRYREFHQAVISACPSIWLKKLDTMLFEDAERYRFLKFKLYKDVKKLLSYKAKAHQQLVKHLLARDTEAALQLQEKIFLSTLQELRDMWPKLDAKSSSKYSGS